jgi:molecular chaperone DnaJ
MPKNYYIILGIPASSTQEDIKAAYKRLAKEYHPDRYPKGHTPFQNIQEAYSILGDPSSRREYDRKRSSRPAATGYRSGSRAVHESPASSVEPLIPENNAPGYEHLQPRHMFQRYRPAFDELFEQSFNTIEELHAEEKDQDLPGAISVALSPDEARHGGQIRVAIPARLSCPACRGRGGTGFYECWRCSGTGLIRGSFPVVIAYPPGIRDAHTAWLSLDRYGLPGRQLSVNFIIDRLI